MLEKKFPDIYKLELLENLNVHPVFHVSFLKPGHGESYVSVLPVIHPNTKSVPITH